MKPGARLLPQERVPEDDQLPGIAEHGAQLRMIARFQSDGPSSLSSVVARVSVAGARGCHPSPDSFAPAGGFGVARRALPSRSAKMFGPLLQRCIWICSVPAMPGPSRHHFIVDQHLVGGHTRERERRHRRAHGAFHRPGKSGRAA